MPRPAPSTVPVRRPITKLPPPLPSFSKRSYPSAMSPPQVPSSGSRFRVLSSRRARLEHRLHRDAETADEADDAARLRAYVRSHAVRGVVDAIDRAVNRLIDAVGFFFHFGGDVLDVVENRVHPRHRRRDLPRLETVDEIHHAPVDDEAPDADADDRERFEHAR